MNRDILERLKKSDRTLSETEDVKFISTGCYTLNRVISGRYNEGLPLGCIVQLQGDSSTGKTLFATTFLSSAQKNGWYTKLLDAENTFSKDFGRKLGIDPDTLLYSTPVSLEDAFEDVDKTIKEIRELDKDTPMLFIIDSVAVLPTREEYNREDVGEISPTDGARRALIFGNLLRKINPRLKANNATLVVINQIRSKINVMYGNPETTAAGGKSLEFYLSVDLKTTSNKTSDVVKDDNKNPIGIEGNIKVKKNKVGIPFQECSFLVLFDKGLDPFYGIEEWLANDGLITRSDSGRLSVGDIKFKKGTFSTVLMDPALSDPALDKVRGFLGINIKGAVNE